MRAARPRRIPTSARRCAGAASRTSSTSSTSTRSRPATWATSDASGGVCRALTWMRPVPGRQRVRAPDRGRRRRSSTWTGGEVIEVDDHGVVPLPPADARRVPRRPLPVAERDGPQADRDHPAGGPELHRRRATGALAEVAPAGRLQRRARASCCTRSATTTAARCGRSCTARRSREMVVPYGDPAPDPPHPERRSTSASTASACSPTRSSSAATASARSTTSTRVRQRRTRRRRSTIPNAICMHEEDYGILWKHTDFRTGDDRGAPLAPARHLVDLDRRQLRVRLLLVLLPGRHDRVRGQADRHHLDRRGARRARRRATGTLVAPGLYGAASTSTSSTSGSTSTSTASANSVYEVDTVADADRPGEPVRQRVPRPCARCSRREAEAPAADRPAPRAAPGTIVNPEARNALGEPVGLQADPGRERPAVRAARTPRSAAAPASRTSTCG